MWQFRSEEGKKAAVKAMHLLEHMDRTEKGLTDKLRQSGFSSPAIAEGVEYVKSFGYLKDERYARNYILGRIENKSQQRIFQELLQKGIDRQTAEEAWEELCEDYEPDERRMIREWIQKKYPDREKLEQKELRRLYGFLERRGFRFSDIQAVLQENFNF